MDVARPPEVAQRRRRNRIIAGAAGALVIVITTVGLARLKPAAPTVEAGGLWIEPVKRGTMLRNVRGTGVLVPDEIRWITALTDGTVERVVVLPGTPVEADTILLELSNPQTQQAAMTADLDLRTAQDNYEVLKADLDRDLLAQRALAAGVAADAAQAAMNADADEQMAKQGLISAIQLRRSKLLAETSAARQKMEEQRLATSERTLAVKLAVQQSEVKRRETMAALRRAEATGLKIRAGVAGRASGSARAGRAAHRSGHESRARRRSDAIEGATAGCGDAGQGCRHRSEGRSRHAQIAESREGASCVSTPQRGTAP